MALHREEAIDRLWPDKDLKDGGNNLHRALHDARSVLGESTPFLDKGVVRLPAGTRVDVVEIEALARSGERDALVRTLDLYRGDLCPDDPYGPDLGRRRDELRALFVDSCLRLSRLAVGQGLLDQAMGALRRLLRVESDHEEAHRALSGALLDANRRAEALRQSDLCLEAVLGRRACPGDAPPARGHRDGHGRCLAASDSAGMARRRAPAPRHRRFVGWTGGGVKAYA